VLAIGDSLTQGRRGNGISGHADGPTQSFRYPFWKALRERHANVDMVGTLQTGFEGDPDWPSVDGAPFDRDHESKWGWELDQVTAMLREHLPALQFDVAIIVLGGNDIKNGDSIAQVMAEWLELLALLRQHAPRVVIVLGAVCAEFEPLASYRHALVAAAPSFSTRESPVIVANGCEGWVSDPAHPDSHTVDWIHPNARGDVKLSRAFLRAIEPWLQSRSRPL
jgi:lysophospholipase L1-like esterase